MSAQPDATASVDATAAAVRSWIAEHTAELAPYREHSAGSIEDTVERWSGLQGLLFDAGWSRLGWPESCGGLGGSPVLRATVLEELAAAGYVVPETHGTVEIISPMLIRYAPDLAAEHVPLALSGRERWCQGFSEPDAGSDLGSLRTRAVEDGDGFRLTGQKMWSSYGHVADRCCVLARSGAADSGYKGLTMFWVDMDTPGISVVPTMCESGRAETAEIFFEDVFVPRDRLVGGVGDGWKVVMYLLQFERGAYAWLRQGEMHTELRDLIARTGDAEGDLPADVAEQVGNAYLAVFALRAQCSPTIAKLGAGLDLGPEISIDKIMLGQTEQLVADTARNLQWPALELDDDEHSRSWRRRWAYSRITTIYGGAAEVQRDLVAERLLGLPRSR